jgi:GR25 family glycosyltransferase involved in LPS biosynthesis
MQGPFVINLEHRTDRWENVTKEFGRIGIKPQRWPATYDSARGFLGCLKSHTALLKHLCDSTVPVWICEDDIEFLCSAEQVVPYIQGFLKSPAEVLCLGFNSYKQVEYNEQFHRTLSCQTTSSYIVKPTMIKRLYDLYESVVDCIENNKKHPMEDFYKTLVHVPDFYCPDQCWKILQQDSLWLIPNKRVLRQAESYSDIEKKVVSYGV